MRWLVLVILLVSCRSVPVPSDSYVVIVEHLHLLEDNSKLIIGSKRIDLHFSFITQSPEYLKPRFYAYGPAWIVVVNDRGDSMILANVSSMVHVTFYRPGKLTLLFIWQRHRSFGPSKTITIEYRPY